MKRIIITRYNEINILLIYEEDVLVEVHPISNSDKVQIGNIYLGRVQKKLKNIDAAFVSLDGDNVGYLPLDDKPAIVLNRKLPKGLPSIAENDLILVQVEQEPQKMKQARLTGNINLSGKYCVVDLESGKNGISKKITDNASREKITKLLYSFVEGITDYQDDSVNMEKNESVSLEADITKNQSNTQYGYVLRTACENADYQEIITELNSITARMNELIHRAAYERNTGLLIGDVPEYISIIENYGIERIDEIKTDISDVYKDLINYFEDNNINYNIPYNNSLRKSLNKDDLNDNTLNISVYDDKEYPYYKLLGLESEISKLLNKKVWLKSGGFLVIEPTEAMVVIDVNTGKAINKKNRDTHVLKINIEAAVEAARQIRLRNLSGIIMIDFINMSTEEDKKKVVNCLRREFEKDKVSTHFIEITKLDVFEITRKKQRRPIYEILQ